MTACPYKGTTSRAWSIRTSEGLVEDAIWVYDDPLAEAHGITGMLAFYQEKVSLEVETRPVDHPQQEAASTA